jgi:hypothetical protein
MNTPRLALLLPLALAVAACSAPAEEDADSSTGAATATTSAQTMLTYLGRLPQPAAGAANTYALRGVRPGQFAFFDIDYKDATSFTVAISADLRSGARPLPALPPSLGGGQMTDIPPIVPLTIGPFAVFAVGSEKSAPIPKPTWSAGMDVPDADVNKALAALPASARLVNQPTNADASFAIQGIEKTDLGIRVHFLFATDMAPGSAVVRLVAADAR